jgi:hypothetical protein
MKSARIQALVDELLARDQCYRPIELLIASKRLDPAGRQRWESGEVAFLEDLLAGNPSRSIEMLRQADQWARRLELDGQVEALNPGQGRLFRNPNDDQLARTVWHRRQTSPQGDLFLDSGFAAARGRLARSLLEADRAGAEIYLSEMASAEPGNTLQADAEQLAGALSWLEQPPDDPKAWYRRMAKDLVPRAQRFLGPDQSRQYLNRFRAHLATHLDAKIFDPAHPELHPASLAAESGDWEKVLEAVRSVDQPFEHARLMELTATAGLKTENRDTGLIALCQLCWRHPREAETWLERTDDPEIAERITRYWDLDEPLTIELFPAWLISIGYPLPDMATETLPDTPEARALAGARRLRRQPGDAETRRWFKENVPDWFEVWLRR